MAVFKFRKSRESSSVFTRHVLGARKINLVSDCSVRGALYLSRVDQPQVMKRTATRTYSSQPSHIHTRLHSINLAEELQANKPLVCMKKNFKNYDKPKTERNP